MPYPSGARSMRSRRMRRSTSSFLLAFLDPLPVPCAFACDLVFELFDVYAHLAHESFGLLEHVLAFLDGLSAPVAPRLCGVVAHKRPHARLRVMHEDPVLPETVEAA